MNSKEAEFLKKILATFQAEAQEHVQNIYSGLRELTQGTDPARRTSLVENIFRETHSLKGAARSVDQREIEAICQPLESAFAALKRDELDFTPELAELVQEVVDHIARLAGSLGAPQSADGQSRQMELVQLLRRVTKDGVAVLAGRDLGTAPAVATPQPPAPPEADPPGPSPDATAPPPDPAPPPLATPAAQMVTPPAEPLRAAPASESVRIPTAKLDPLLRQAEEMVMAKMAAAQRVTDLREILHQIRDWRSGPGKGAVAGASGGAGDARLHDLQGQLEALVATLAEDHRAVKKMVDEHLDAVKTVLMMPVSSMVEVLPRLVRELSRDQGKQVELTIHGTEIEMDKRILDELKVPLIHLLRNSIDHGLKPPTQRRLQGKPAQGTITLAVAAHDSRQVRITLSDDGEGIDLEQVRAAALAKGLLSEEEARHLPREQTLALIFRSGVSTSPIITDISGRGLGLAIVREKVEQLGGTITIDSQASQGTTFSILVPMTLATFRGVLVRAGRGHFLLPTGNVQRMVRVPRQQVMSVGNRKTVTLDGAVLSLVNLAACLGVPEPQANGSSSAAKSAQIMVAILASGDRSIAFEVDEVLDEQQVLLKGLGRQLSKVRNLAGAVVLGNGKVVPVLNVGDLMLSALREPGLTRQEAQAKPAARGGRIMVAEDSITARTLIRNILENAGFQVTTAVDGADAFNQLRVGEYDLVVSDVDMPRLNGFELTTRIRADAKLNEIPVVLVTALNSRQDRERGIEVGANAYIVKSSFDQSNLLGVISKLL